MKLGIVGSREFNDYELFMDYMKQLVPNPKALTLIVSGGAKGADTLAERYARENNIPMDVHSPNFKFGKAAYFIRNQEIVDTSDHIVAFPTGDSRGTYNTISKARKAGKPVTVINI